MFGQFLIIGAPKSVIYAKTLFGWDGLAVKAIIISSTGQCLIHFSFLTYFKNHSEQK